MQIVTAETLSLSRNCVYRTEAFGGVLFDLETKQYVPVNRMGYEIVDFLATQPSPVEALVDDVATRVSSMLGQPVQPAQVCEPVEQFLAELTRNGFVAGYTPARTDIPTPALAVPQEKVQLKAPLVVSLATNFNCNLYCADCYVGSTNDIPPDSATVTEILQTLEMLGELEVFDVVITGGETLLFPDIFTVLERAKQVIPYVCLNSNGTGIVPWIAKRLAAIGLDVVKISIDSPHPEVHDRFRGQPGAFKRSVQGIKRLVAEGVRVDTHTVISRESVNSIEDIDALLSLAQSLGVTKVHFGRLFATGRGANEQKLDFEHLTSINDYLDSLKESNPLIGRTPSKTRPYIPQMPWYDGCGGCGRGIYAYIAYNGKIFPCTNLYKPERPEVCMGDLREQSFATIWQHSPNYQRLQALLSTAVAGSEGIHE
jgi:MoaA/NifB/PqqE/SkfB family radical SAM enzyme